VRAVGIVGGVGSEVGIVVVDIVERDVVMFEWFDCGIHWFAVNGEGGVPGEGPSCAECVVY
jgi:hypothetical protein